MSKVKRERAANWSEAEKSGLLDLVKERIDLVENKSCGGKLIKMKADAWNEIHTIFVAQYAQKDINRMKEQWRRMKLNSKTNISKHTKKQKGTRGGPPPSKKDEPSETDWAIKDLLPHEFVKDDNEFDDDGSEELETIERNDKISDFENDDILLFVNNNRETKGTGFNNVVIERGIANAKQLLASNSGICESNNSLPKSLNSATSRERPAENEEYPTASSSGMTSRKPVDDSVRDVENNQSHMKQPIPTTSENSNHKQILHCVKNGESASRDLIHIKPKRSKKATCSANNKITEYETSLLLLHKKRITQQMRFDEERHNKQLEVLEAELQYWKSREN